MEWKITRIGDHILTLTPVKEIQRASKNARQGGSALAVPQFHDALRKSAGRQRPSIKECFKSLAARVGGLASGTRSASGCEGRAGMGKAAACPGLRAAWADGGFSLFYP